MAVYGGTVYPDALTTASGDNPVSVLVSGASNSGPRVLHIQNNTAEPIYIAYDKPASRGSHMIAPGELYQDTSTTCVVLHVYTVSAGLSLNGTTVNGIVVWGNA